MNVTGKTYSKRLNYVERLPAEDEAATIYDLHFDCLSRVLKYLSPYDRLTAELVSRAWKDVAEASWSSMKTIEFEDAEATKNVNLSIVRRCGSYLEDIKVRGAQSPGDSNLLPLLKVISKYCRDILSLEIKRIWENEVELENNLSLVFQNNRRLHSLTLVDLKITGRCLSSLFCEKITRIELVQCHSESIDQAYFYHFFSRLKSVEIFFVVPGGCLALEGTISALHKSNCTGLQNFRFPLITNENLSPCSVKFFAKQPKLNVLRLGCFRASIKFLTSLLVCEEISVLEVEVDDEVSSILYNFSNLSTFVGHVSYLTDRLIENLSDCKNLDTIQFRMVEDYPSQQKNHFKRFHKLANLEIFTSITAELSMESFLSCVSECRNLQCLGICCGYSKCSSDFVNLKLFRNLIKLTLRRCAIRSSEFVSLVRELIQLREIFLIECDKINISEKLLAEVNEVKTERQDIQQLQIYHRSVKFDESVTREYDLLTVEPL